MIAFLTAIHVVICFVLIGIILLQPGKGADLAGAFGGQGSQTAFGPRGTANLLTKVTAWAAVLFAITSVSLTVLIARRGNGTSVLHGMQSAPTHSVPASRK